MQTNPYERFVTENAKPTRWGAMISRTTMGVLGLVLLYGGYRCIHAAYRIWAELLQDHQRTTLYNHNGSGAGLPATIGVVLVMLGTILTSAAILPVSRLERMFSPPSSSLGEEPADSWFTTLLSILRWW